MRFRYSLEHNPSFEREVDGLAQWLTRSTGANPDWVEGDQPSVTLPSDSGNVGDPITSEIIYTNYPFISGNQYTVEVEFTKVLNTGSTTNPRTLYLEIYNASFVAQFTTNVVTSVSSGQTISLTFTATSSCTRIGVYAEDNSNVTITLNDVTLTPPTPDSTSQEISEPDGWEGSKIILERDYDFQSLIEHYEGAAGGGFLFYGEDDDVNGGAQFIKDIEEEFGFDANISLLVELAPDDVNYQELFVGLLDLSAKDEQVDNMLQVPVVRDDFWVRFMNRKETPVNLSDLVDLDGRAVDPVDPITLDLPSQPIRKVHYSTEVDQGITVTGVVDDEYVQFTPGKFELDEMDNFYNLVPINQTELPAPSFDVVEEGTYNFDIRWTISNVAGATENHANSLDVYIQVNDETAVAFSASDQTSVGVDYTYFTHSSSRYLLVGDVVRIYAVQDSPSTLNWGFWGTNGLKNGTTYDQPRPAGMEDIPTYTRVTADTVVPATQAAGYLIHDLIHGVLARMGLGTNPFYSEFLGSTLTHAVQYAEDGCGWGYVIVKGLQLRQYTLTEKPFFISFQQIWDGINPILNLGLGYEIIDDTPDRQVIRIEQKDHFLADDISVTFSNVRTISTSYDHDYIFKRIKTGYKKWQADDISGIDDYGKQVRATKFEKDGKEINLESDFIAAGLTIETTRRTSRIKSADYKYDNDNFIVVINPDDVSPDRYTPELDENFDSVSGILHGNKRYNLVISPMRNFLRWAKFFGGALQSYPTSIYRFVSGEGNYDMLTDYSCSFGLQCQGIVCDPLKERANISLSDYNTLFEHYHLAQLITMTVPLEWEDYQTIRDNRKKAIRISQTNTDFTTCKLKSIEYDIIKAEAVIKAWPKTFFRLQVVDQEIEMDCIPADVADGFAECYQDVLDYGESI